MVGSSRPARRMMLVGLAVVATVVGSILTPALALPNTSSPTLTVDRVIHTNPFTGSSTKMKDGEASTYVPSDDSLWLGEDVTDQAYEVNRATGALKRVITKSEFANAPKFGGGPVAGTSRISDFESLAYDPNSDTLYAFSGKCCDSTVLPTAYRLQRGGDGKFHVESYQPLPSGSDFTASAIRPADGKLYVGNGSSVRQYTYTTNTVGSTLSLSGVSGVYGIGFSSDSNDLLVAAKGAKLYRVNWATRTVVPGWSFTLTSFGINDSRAVELINDQFYVLDGYDSRSSSDPLKYAVYVFNVVGSGSPPNAGFTGSPTSGDAPLAVQFTDTSTGSPTSWSWNFGDGGTSTEQNPSHTYDAAGTYSVTLTASNAGGSDTFTRNNYISVAAATPPPAAGFTGSPTSGNAPLAVQFTDTSTGSPTSWSWDFGDGGTSTEQNPSHTYAAGTFTVKLTAANAGGSNTFTRTDYIQASGVDTTPPETFIDSGPPASTSSTSATFTFHASEPSTFTCDLDGAGFVPCTSPQSYSGLAATSHTFQVVATDAATISDPTPASATWTVTQASATIAREAVSTTVNATTSSTITIAPPAGTSAGDVLVACMALNGGTVRVAPAGWTQIAAVTSITNPHVYGYYKVAGASEPAATWTLSASVASGGGIARYSGVNNTSPLDATTTTGASGTEVTAASVPSVTTADPNAMLVGCVGINSSAVTVTITAPAGMSKAWDIGGKRNQLDDQLQATAGPSGAKTWTLSSRRAYGAWLTALRPA
jgi:PKD repeat protein